MSTPHKTREDYSRELAEFGSVYDRGFRLSYNEADSREEGGTGEVWVIQDDRLPSRTEAYTNRAHALARFVRFVRALS